MKGIKLKSFEKVKLTIFQMGMPVILNRLQTCPFPKGSNFLSPFLLHLGSNIYPSLLGDHGIFSSFPSFFPSGCVYPGLIPCWKALNMEGTLNI